MAGDWNNKVREDMVFAESRKTLNHQIEDNANKASANLQRGVKQVIIGFVSLLLFFLLLGVFNKLSLDVSIIRTTLVLILFVAAIFSITLFYGVYNIIVSVLFRRKNK
ncbi:hypothetical protein [Desnuesiella massiliensis]|uniref:hypothetical protein n=1 Tax=Desnuesiella massiliensis TaxID=1650662 RepID=UPI0006E28B83|nr:hypothetical protein [Desnuesiella massiliensis]